MRNQQPLNTRPYRLSAISLALALTAGATLMVAPAAAQDWLEAARASAADAMAAPADWTGPEAPTVPAADKFVVIVNPVAAPAVLAQSSGVEEGAAALGWRTLTIDGQGLTDQQVQAIDQAINQNADAVVLINISDETTAPAIERARQAGLVVVGVGTENQPWENGVNADVSLNWNPGGRRMADWLMSHTDGQGHFAIVNSPEFRTIRGYLSELKAGLQSCLTCSIDAEMDIALADLSTTAGARLVALLQTNPDVEIVVAPYDFAVGALAAAVDQAGLGDRVKFVSANGDPQNLAFVAAGTPQVMVMASPFNWAGWGAVDTLNRIFNGDEVVSEGIPIRLFTVENQADIPSDYWGGDFDYKAKYLSLWGLN